MTFIGDVPVQSLLREKMTAVYRADEAQVLETLLPYADLPQDALNRIKQRAHDLVAVVRSKRLGSGGLDAFMFQYNLSSDEGIALMCLAEALLRIPDKHTQDKLIRDKLTSAEWQEHAGKSDSMFVNAATWGLMLTGKIYSLNEDLSEKKLSNALKKLTARSGEPVIRQAVGYAMKVLGKQFVMGRTIDEALKRAKEQEAKGYRYSYDMLGEAARTFEDAQRYFDAYTKAIHEIGAAANKKGVASSPGISIKLSALYPRYEWAKQTLVHAYLVPKLTELALLAKSYQIHLTVDAEEAERLDLSLDIFAAVFGQADLDGWHGLGLAVQAYQKRAFYLIDWLAELADTYKRPIMLRLVKGAYWDAEIKLSQEKGLSGYPVFTRKAATDVSYLACAKKILSYNERFYPAFATHNAYTVAAIMEMAGERQDFEFQCLHGMGDSLYDEIVGADKFNRVCRVYAPVGTHEDLLAYLVRRLLENGANSSFVNRIVDAKEPIERLIQDPVAMVAALASKPHPKIPLPVDLFGASRANSMGMDLTNMKQLQALKTTLTQAASQTYTAGPIVGGVTLSGEEQPVFAPFDHQRVVGTAMLADAAACDKALTQAYAAHKTWVQTSALERAACLRRAADLLAKEEVTLMALAMLEAGKTVTDAIAELREAIDFCRYYAAEAEAKLAEPITLPGPTGESNQLYYHGRGLFICISPWNFPLAIFMGQIAAALVAGNTVIAKPAEQTPLIAAYAVKLLHQAGIPVEVLHLLPGTGETVGARLVADSRIAGVMFTGSTETAKLINRTLAQRDGAIIPFIAETGGQNAMIVDSSALPEQVVADVINSAFGSAGQRCSALRVLYLQEDVADKILTMLKGAMATLTVGDPRLLSTDVGPVIDAEAKAMLEQHQTQMKNEAQIIYQCQLSEKEVTQGYFVAPTAYEIQDLSLLKREVFGPCLHVIRFKAAHFADVLADINATGYGLTFGVHSRIESTVNFALHHAKVGNAYINRSMIGAVVGVQPFGGEGLSGTGPKAGGPNYLYRLCVEQSVSINTTASGGNASLMSLDESS